MHRNNKSLPIGIFDSGVGGLTVLQALQQHLPFENYLYLGDTARLPYGTKSAEIVKNYALQAADALIERGVKVLVVACNTASSVALHALQDRFYSVPVIGVVAPGAKASHQAAPNGRIAIIATEGTVLGGAYTKAIYQLNPKATIEQWACGLLVAMVEEGWTEGALVQKIVATCLAPLLDKQRKWFPDCLLLGCTHFPILRKIMKKVLDPNIQIVDSGQATSEIVYQKLLQQDLLNDGVAPGQVYFLATDSLSRFIKVAKIFLGEPILPQAIELVSLRICPQTKLATSLPKCFVSNPPRENCI